jgi:hypothetical protein
MVPIVPCHIRKTFPKIDEKCSCRLLDPGLLAPRYYLARQLENAWNQWCGTTGFKGNGYPEFLVSSVCGVLGGLPAELGLAVQCLRHVMARGRLKRVGPRQYARRDP